MSFGLILGLIIGEILGCMAFNGEIEGIIRAFDDCSEGRFRRDARICILPSVKDHNIISVIGSMIYGRIIGPFPSPLL